MPTSFLMEHRVADPGRLHLLPTANVVFVVHQADSGTVPSFVLPHRSVVVVEDVADVVSLSPNLIKCLLGEPCHYLERVLRTTEHMILEPFSSLRDASGLAVLLEDLRDSLTMQDEERDFLVLWGIRGERRPLPTNDRRIQRLCLRYAGQAPKTINMLWQLAHTLNADNASGRSNTLGLFADASHLGRICKDFTGRTPRAWRNLSQTFY